MKKDNIIEFENKKQFYENILYGKNLLNNELGYGYEGIVYLSDLDKKAYKILGPRYELMVGKKFKPNEVITTKDIELKNIILPELLYTVKKELVACRMKYI